MRLKRLILPPLLALYAVIAAQSVLADYTAGDFIIRLGGSYVEPDDKHIVSNRYRFDVEDADDEDADPVRVDVGVDLRLDDDTTWYISGVWLFLNHWGLELHHINRARHDADLTYGYTVQGGATRVFENVRINDFKAYSTSLFVNWYPVCVESWIQPYVGLGINYTDFDDERLRPVFHSDGDFIDGRIGLGSSFRFAAQIGVDVVFGRHSNWLVNASVMYIDSDPYLELGYNFPIPATDGLPQNTSIPIRIRQDIDYDPWVFNLGIGYKFSF